MEYTVRQLGVIRAGEDGFRIALEPEYRAALAGLEDFRWVNVLWWFSGCGGPEDRALRREVRPYAHGPEALGVFATRSPRRPNPIALSCAEIAWLDEAEGLVGLGYVDAEDGSPVLDLKPYTPSLDRVESPVLPGWCAHWPKSVEASGDFDWSGEFNF